MSTNFSVAGHEHWLGLDHSLVVRGEFGTKSSVQEVGYSGPMQSITTVADLDPRRIRIGPFARYPTALYEQFLHSGGFTLADIISWRDRFDLNLSVRRSLPNAFGRTIKTLNGDPSSPDYGRPSSISIGIESFSTRTLDEATACRAPEARETNCARVGDRVLLVACWTFWHRRACVCSNGQTRASAPEW